MGWDYKEQGAVRLSGATRSKLLEIRAGLQERLEKRPGGSLGLVRHISLAAVTEAALRHYSDYVEYSNFFENDVIVRRNGEIEVLANGR